MQKLYTAISGNRALCEKLGSYVIDNSLPHALIVEGDRGRGKHTVVKMTAAALVCENKGKAEHPLPCLECLSCRKVLEGKSPDIITINRGDKATLGIDAVRFLKEDVHIVPNDSDHKIYVIEESDKMTHQAQNSLLLTLEEPPRYVHFFLLCEKADLLLETIKSRAPILRVEPLSRKEIDEYITANDRRALQMKISDPESYDELLTASASGIGRAIEYLDSNTFSPVKKNRAISSDFVIAAISGKGAKAIIPMVTRFPSSRESLLDVLGLISQALRDLIVLKKSDDVPLLFFSNRNDAIELSDKTSLAFLYNINDCLSTTIYEISRNSNTKLSLIKFIIKAKLI